jgi:hypothetical protein
MKELKDYLHLYLGCRIKSKGGNFGDLISVSNDGMSIVVYDKDKINDPRGLCIYSDWLLPILRPLSDMTDKEGEEFFGDVMNFRGQFQFHYGFKYRYEEGFHCIYDNATDKWYTIIKPDANGLPVFNCTYSMEDTLWLLSKHFDLFGLIESGLAIDKTTLKEKI